MKSFLLKYWLGIIGFIMLTATVFFFIPVQERYYLHADLILFKKRISYGFILFLGLLFIILIISGSRNNRTIGEWVLFVCNLFLLSGALYFALSPLVKFTFLYTNRLAHHHELNRKFVKDQHFDDSTERNFVLYGIGTKEVIWSNQLPVSVLHSIHAQHGDTIQLKMVKGLYNVCYVTDL